VVLFLLHVAFERREVLTASHNYGRRLRGSVISPSRKIQMPVAASLFVRMTVAVSGCGGHPAPTQLVSFHFHSMPARSSSASLKDKGSEPLRRYVDILADGRSDPGIRNPA
jgi:hypothetical protein